MLNQPTIEKLHAMNLHGTANAFRAQLETAGSSQLSFEERFTLRPSWATPSENEPHQNFAASQWVHLNGIRRHPVNRGH